jgi:Protein of unknown function (DUF1460)
LPRTFASTMLILLFLFNILMPFPAGIPAQKEGGQSVDAKMRDRVQGDLRRQMRLGTIPCPPGSRLFKNALPAQNNPDSLIFLQKRALLSAKAPLAGQALAVAKSFQGVPYTIGTLERGDPEQLIVNLRQLDCWTLVENAVAIALTGPEGSYAAYLDRLRNLRYWGGTIDGYGSRIHYFCGWALQAEKSGLMEDLTRDFGGIPLKKRFDYITRRPAKYPKIRDENTFRALRRAEQRISAHAWHYIPKSKVAAAEKKIQEGDIILLASSKAGLDIAHEGFAVKIKGRIHLLHASSLGDYDAAVALISCILRPKGACQTTPKTTQSYGRSTNAAPCFARPIFLPISCIPETHLGAKV